MAKGMTQSNPKSFDDVNDILRVPAKRAKLQSFIDEAVRCRMKILDEQESIKGIREAAVDDLNIQPKMFNTLVSLFFNNNFEQKQLEIQQLDCAIEALMQIGNDD